MKRSVRVFILLAISLQTGAAQAPAPSPAPTGTTALSEIAPISRLAPASAKPPSDSSTLTLDYLYNRKPQDGSVAHAIGDVTQESEDKENALNALTPPRLDDPILRDEFETYLNLPEVPADRIRRYVDKIRQITELLKKGDIATAEASLQELGDDQDLDAGVSRELAHQVGSLAQARRAILALDQVNRGLWKKIETYSWNIDQMNQELRNGGKENDSPPIVLPGDLTPNGQAPNPLDDGLAGKLELADEYSKLLDTRIEIKTNGLQSADQMDDAQSDFASFVTTLFSNHRYDLVILAANFYRKLCPEEGCPASMKDEIDASLASNQQVDSNLEAFQHRFEQGELAGATDRLAEAFIGSPCHPGVQGIPLSEKQHVSDYLRHLDALKNVLETYDLRQVQEQVAYLRKIATDFDSTLPLALVKKRQVESYLHLGRARLMAQQGNLNEVMAELQSAADLWPNNPDLTTQAESFFNSQDLKNKAVNEFDQLVKEQDYRAIFDRQTTLAVAVKGDAGREQQLSAALEKVRQAQVALDSASISTLKGNLAVAWEKIDSAARDWPEDVKLNRMLMDLSARDPDFASAISKAREAEAKNELGYSLTWYVNAQKFYPGSQIASAGINRISQRILASGSVH